MNNHVITFSHKQVAVQCFNKVWDLLEKDDRTNLEDEEMVHMCHTSFWHWTQVEDHTEQNLSIGYWQLSRVYAMVGNGEQALEYAQRCIAVSIDAKLAPFYIAYAYEAMSRAYTILKQKEQAQKCLELANEYTKSVIVEESKKLLKNDLKELMRLMDTTFSKN
ncbi:tetratricopeptide repeat protein [Fredinandcohnia humi]